MKAEFKKSRTADAGQSVAKTGNMVFDEMHPESAYKKRQRKGEKAKCTET